jgi:Raf kinase inhibitor-like YbhB/YbcL family protein
MRLTSSAFEPGADIPQRFTCDGPGISPPLALHDIPAGAESLVLVMDDPDAPGGTWDHWVAYDIPVGDVFEEGIGRLGVAGRNSWGRTGYGGPCPPRGTHRYIVAVYALDTMLHLPAGAEKAKVLGAIESHVLAEARLMGRYARSGG